MQMIARAVAGAADVADHLALPDSLARRNADGGAMGVERFKPVSVVDFDKVAVTSAPRIRRVGDGDCAVRCREDGRPSMGRDVGAGVEIALTCEWVDPLAKAGGDRERFGQRPLEDACPNRDILRSQNLPAAADIPAEQFHPERLVLRVRQKRELLVLPCGESERGGCVLWRLLPDRDLQHGFRNDYSLRHFLAVLVHHDLFFLMFFCVGTIGYGIHLP